MSGETWFPRADYIRLSWSHEMIEHMRWLTEAACAATGATPGDFSTFGDQEGLGMAFDYRPPASDSGTGFEQLPYDFTARRDAADALAAGIGEDNGALVAAIARLSDQVQDLCATIEAKDHELDTLRRQVRDLQIQVEGI